tara:strand:+ start:334 stop:480 length:147 start_codon:yes stop_codon:yes gene_type:complete
VDLAVVDLAVEQNLKEQVDLELLVKEMMGEQVLHPLNLLVVAEVVLAL